MEIKILITTPKGNARGTEAKLRTALLKWDAPKKIIINKADNKIIWIIEGDIKKCLKIQKNIIGFQKLAQYFLNNKLVKKGINKLADSPEDYEKLKQAFINNTKIEIIKYNDFPDIENNFNKE